MVTPFYAGASAPRNLACAPHAASLLPASAGAPPVPLGSGTPAVHPGLIEHPDLTPEVQVALLAAVDEAVIAELGDLACAIPDHPRPISAVLALVDAGLLALDLQAGFDASLRVWQTSVIVTTNLAFGEWPSVFGDPNTAEHPNY